MDKGFYRRVTMAVEAGNYGGSTRVPAVEIRFGTRFWGRNRGIRQDRVIGRRGVIAELAKDTFPSRSSLRGHDGMNCVSKKFGDVLRFTDFVRETTEAATPGWSSSAPID